MERIKNGHIKEIIGVKVEGGHYRHHREENAPVVWPR